MYDDGNKALQDPFTAGKFRDSMAGCSDANNWIFERMLKDAHDFWSLPSYQEIAADNYQSYELKGYVAS